MSATPELLRATEVRKEWEQVIDDVARPLAEKHQLEYVSWYHDSPLWYVGEVQLGLIRSQGMKLLEIHKGDDNHLALQIEKLGREALHSIVECLITTT